MKKWIVLFVLALLLQSATWKLDTQTGEEGLIKGQRQDIYSLGFSPDGKWLASGSIDGTTFIRSTRDWSVTKELAGHGNWITATEFSPEGRFLVTAGLDEQVKVWDLETGLPVQELRSFNKGVLSLAFSPDGKWLAAGDLEGTLTVFDTSTWQVAQRFKENPGGISALRFSPDGRHLASAGFDDALVRIWQISNWELVKTLGEHQAEIYTLSFSPDGRYLASAGKDRAIWLWDATSWRPLSKMTGHTQAIWSLAFSPDSQLLGSGGIDDKTIRLWQVPQGVNIQTLKSDFNTTYALLFQPGTSHFLSGHEDKAIRVWVPEKQVAKALGADFQKTAHALVDLMPLNMTLAALPVDDDAQGASMGNGNQKIEGGELVEVAFEMANRGTRPLQNLKIEVTLKTQGAIFQGAAQNFSIQSFPMGAKRKLVLPIFIPKSPEFKTLDLGVRLHSQMQSYHQVETLSFEVQQ